MSDGAFYVRHKPSPDAAWTVVRINPEAFGNDIFNLVERCRVRMFGDDPLPRDLKFEAIMKARTAR